MDSLIDYICGSVTFHENCWSFPVERRNGSHDWLRFLMHNTPPRYPMDSKQLGGSPPKHWKWNTSKIEQADSGIVNIGAQLWVVLWVYQQVNCMRGGGKGWLFEEKNKGGCDKWQPNIGAHDCMQCSNNVQWWEIGPLLFQLPTSSH